MDIDALFATDAAPRQSWPFKHMQVGEVAQFRASETRLHKAGAAARAYAQASGKTFLTRKREVEGEMCLFVKRVADKPETALAVDGRTLRRIHYGFEDLEVGQSIEITDHVEARKAVSGINNRQRETGRKWTAHRELRKITEGGMEITSEVVVIKRVI